LLPGANGNGVASRDAEDGWISIKIQIESLRAHDVHAVLPWRAGSRCGHFSSMRLPSFWFTALSSTRRIEVYARTVAMRYAMRTGRRSARQADRIASRAAVGGAWRVGPKIPMPWRRPEYVRQTRIRAGCRRPFGGGEGRPSATRSRPFRACCIAKHQGERLAVLTLSANAARASNPSEVNVGASPTLEAGWPGVRVDVLSSTTSTDFQRDQYWRLLDRIWSAGAAANCAVKGFAALPECCSS